VPIAPRPDVHSAAFWDGLRKHQVVVVHCGDCFCNFLPPTPTCPHCGGRNLSGRVVPGTGTVYSWVGVHRPLSPTPVVDPPYAIVTVDLDNERDPGEGPDPLGEADRLACRMFGRLEPAEAAAIGLAVVPDFVDHDSWTELIFRPRSA
jgi:uncharacterized OB-fold protein